LLPAIVTGWHHPEEADIFLQPSPLTDKFLMLKGPASNSSQGRKYTPETGLFGLFFDAST
jgi:hypothetical protein